MADITKQILIAQKLKKQRLERQKIGISPTSETTQKKKDPKEIKKAPFQDFINNPNYTVIRNEMGDLAYIRQKPKQYMKEKSFSDDKKYNTYVPKELVFDNQGNLAEIIERKEYTTQDKQRETTERIRKSVYVSSRTIYKNNLPQKTQTYSPYLSNYEWKKNRSERDYKLFLSSEKNYEKGMVISEKVYSSYRKYYSRTDDGDKGDKEYSIFLKEVLDYKRKVKTTKPTPQGERFVTSTKPLPSSKWQKTTYKDGVANLVTFKDGSKLKGQEAQNYTKALFKSFTGKTPPPIYKPQSEIKKELDKNKFATEQFKDILRAGYTTKEASLISQEKGKIVKEANKSRKKIETHFSKTTTLQSSVSTLKKKGFSDNEIAVIKQVENDYIKKENKKLQLAKNNLRIRQVKDFFIRDEKYIFPTKLVSQATNKSELEKRALEYLTKKEFLGVKNIVDLNLKIQDKIFIQNFSYGRELGLRKMAGIDAPLIGAVRTNKFFKKALTEKENINNQLSKNIKKQYNLKENQIMKLKTSDLRKAQKLRDFYNKFGVLDKNKKNRLIGVGILIKGVQYIQPDEFIFYPKIDEAKAKKRVALNKKQQLKNLQKGINEFLPEINKNLKATLPINQFNKKKETKNSFSKFVNKVGNNILELTKKRKTIGGKKEFINNVGKFITNFFTAVPRAGGTISYKLLDDTSNKLSGIYANDLKTKGFNHPQTQRSYKSLIKHLKLKKNTERNLKTLNAYDQRDVPLYMNEDVINTALLLLGGRLFSGVLGLGNKLSKSANLITKIVGKGLKATTYSVLYGIPVVQTYKTIRNPNAENLGSLLLIGGFFGVRGATKGVKSLFKKGITIRQKKITSIKKDIVKIEKLTDVKARTSLGFKLRKLNQDLLLLENKRLFNIKKLRTIWNNVLKRKAKLLNRKEKTQIKVLTRKEAKIVEKRFKMIKKSSFVLQKKRITLKDFRKYIKLNPNSKVPFKEWKLEVEKLLLQLRSKKKLSTPKRTQLMKRLKQMLGLKKFKEIIPTTRKQLKISTEGQLKNEFKILYQQFQKTGGKGDLKNLFQRIKTNPKLLKRAKSLLKDKGYIVTIKGKNISIKKSFQTKKGKLTGKKRVEKIIKIGKENIKEISDLEKKGIPLTKTQKSISKLTLIGRKNLVINLNKNLRIINILLQKIVRIITKKDFNNKTLNKLFKELGYNPKKSILINKSLKSKEIEKILINMRGRLMNKKISVENAIKNINKARSFSKDIVEKKILKGKKPKSGVDIKKIKKTFERQIRTEFTSQKIQKSYENYLRKNPKSKKTLQDFFILSLENFINKSPLVKQFPFLTRIIQAQAKRFGIRISTKKVLTRFKIIPPSKPQTKPMSKTKINEELGKEINLIKKEIINFRKLQTTTTRQKSFKKLDRKINLLKRRIQEIKSGLSLSTQPKIVRKKYQKLIGRFIKRLQILEGKKRELIKITIKPTEKLTERELKKFFSQKKGIRKSIRFDNKEIAVKVGEVKVKINYAQFLDRLGMQTMTFKPVGKKSQAQFYKQIDKIFKSRTKIIDIKYQNKPLTSSKLNNMIKNKIKLNYSNLLQKQVKLSNKILFTEQRLSKGTKSLSKTDLKTKQKLKTKLDLLNKKLSLNKLRFMILQKSNIKLAIANALSISVATATLNMEITKIENILTLQLKQIENVIKAIENVIKIPIKPFKPKTLKRVPPKKITIRPIKPKTGKRIYRKPITLKIKRTPPPPKPTFKLEFGTPLPRGKRWSFDFLYRERKFITKKFNKKTNPIVVKRLKMRLPINKAIKRGLGIRGVDGTTQRSGQFIIAGITTQHDIDKPHIILRKYRMRKTKNTLRYVEKSKYALDTRGEKKGIRLTRSLRNKKRKPKKKIIKKKKRVFKRKKKK